MDSCLNLVLMGERLRACRNAQNMTMKEFAERCNISERYLADIERGMKAPKLDTLVRIANAAGVSSDYLLQDSLSAKDDDLDILNLLHAFTSDQQKIIHQFICKLATIFKHK